MNRADFVKKVIRYVLFGILAGISVLAGTKVALSSNCSTCPGNGLCAGKSDCQAFLKK